MIFLSSGCYCSEPKVHPKNWNRADASLQKKWYIHYRFYDPQFKDEKGIIKPKLCVIKGMNVFKSLAERREACKVLLQEELHMLMHQGLNPITRTFMNPHEEEMQYEIDPSTPVIDAFTKALEKLSVTNRVRIGIKSIIKGLRRSAQQLRYENIAISQITRRHIKAIMEQCGKNSKQWSNTRYNTYRGYLMMLYKELVELEAVPANPIWDISKKPVTTKIKRVLSYGERTLVNDHLAKVFPRFQQFVHLFFHSGGRKTELLQLKPQMVDLVNQKYRCIIKKGKQYKETERTIKTIALPYWEFFISGCPEDHFIFGKDLLPGIKPMGQDMPSKYWKRLVKTQLGIQADFYSLKHLNTSEVVDALDEQAAASLNAHHSTAMVVNIYDVKQKERQHNRLKNVNNAFI